MAKGSALIALILFPVLTGCDKEDEQEDTEADFDRQELLVNLSDNYVVPGYQQLDESMDDLADKCGSLNSDPNSANLNAARQAWVDALEKWQVVAPFEFGPAMNQNLLNTANLYPVDTSRIEANISSGNYTLGSAVNTDAIGFQAMDYLLFGCAASDQEIVDRFATGENDPGQYLIDVADQLSTKISATSDAWSADYRETFVNSTGTSVGSSLGLLINAYTKYYEVHLRDGKIGIPSGARSSQATPFPDKVEGYYSAEYSREMLEAGLLAYHRIFNGIGLDGTDRKGLADYLDFLEARFEGEPLSIAINDQMEVARQHVDDLNPPLQEAVVDQQQAALDTFDEMQKLVVLYKVDMSSALSILITYTDNDGD